MPIPTKPKPVNIRKTIFLAGLLITFFVYTAYIRDTPGPEKLALRGETMGTYYQVKVANSPLTQKQGVALRDDISGYLREFNAAMSTYLPDSEISTFNESASIEPFPVSPEFARVAWYSLQLSGQTGGAFDPTLDPLINLWGFGHQGSRDETPSPDAIAAAHQKCGYEHLSVPDATHLVKDLPGLQLNLSAVAKGAAVDGLSLLLLDEGLTNTYVDIGGEIAVRGTNPDGIAWRIGVDLPDPESTLGESIVQILSLSNRAVASSGDYRNFRIDENGVRLSHLIDPRTGAPVANDVAGATVVGPNCMAADGMATALMILGAEEGLAYIETVPDVEALVVTRSPDGDFIELPSSGFNAYIAESPAP